jgi:hypothetical protein
MSTAHVVGFSRGVTSAVTAWLVAQEAETILLFHDPGEEPEDNDRFEREVSAYLGLPVTHDSDGRSVSELFEEEGTLGNSLMTPCSRILKQERSWAFCQRLQAEGRTVTLSLGFDAGEMDRWSRARQRYSAIDVAVEAPLIARGWDKRRCLEIVADCWGIRPPLAYEHFDNANCRGCVKGGLAYWGQVYLYDREAWERRAAQEDDFGHTILHSRYGGYPAGSLRAMLPLCLENAARWRSARQSGQTTLRLIDQPCGCGQ